MEISAINSANNFDMNSFLEKTNNENNMASTFADDEPNQSGTTSIDARGFLDKASGYDKMGQSEDKQTDRLNAVLEMAMAGQDVSGLLENVQNLSALEAAETTLDEINADIEENAQEAMSEDTALEEHISDEAQVPVDAENQVPVDANSTVPPNAEGQVPVDANSTVPPDAETQVSAGAEGQISTGSKEAPTNDANNTAETSSTKDKPAKESVDMYV